MRKWTSWLTVLLLATVAATAALADGDSLRSPRRYHAGLDRGLVAVENPADGAQWAAWAYRDGAQYDVAVSRRDASGLWSEPFRFGAGDDADQLQPALAIDSSGTIYLAFLDSRSSRIRLAWLTPGTAEWTSPVDASPAGMAVELPALRVVGDRLVLAFVGSKRVQVVELPVATGEAPLTTRQIVDGPDPFGATATDDGAKTGSDGSSDDPFGMDPPYADSLGRRPPTGGGGSQGQ